MKKQQTYAEIKDQFERLGRAMELLHAEQRQALAARQMRELEGLRVGREYALQKMLKVKRENP